MVHEKPKIGNCSLSVITIEWSYDANMEAVHGEEGKDSEEWKLEQREENIKMAVHAALNGQYSFTCTADPAQFNMCIE